MIFTISIICLLVAAGIATGVILATCRIKWRSDELNGVYSDDFSRIIMTRRDNMEAELQRYNFQQFANEKGIEWSFCEYTPYWSEEAHADISTESE